MEHEPTLFALMVTPDGTRRFTINPDLLSEVSGDPNNGGHVSPDNLRRLIDLLQERLRLEKPRGKTHISVGVKRRRAGKSWPAIFSDPDVEAHVGKTPEDRDRFRRAVKRRMMLEESKRPDPRVVEVILTEHPEARGTLIEILESGVRTPSIERMLKTAREFQCTKGVHK